VASGVGTGYERLGRKRLTLLDVIAQSVGFIGPVFSAAFLIPLIAGFSASGKGAGIAAPFAVILAAIGVFAIGWIIAQYAKRVHAAGSLYDYVSMGLGGRVGAVAGWIYYGGTTVLASAIAVLVGWLFHDVILRDTFGIADPPLTPLLWSLIFVLARFLILYLGVEISTRTQLTLALVSAVVVLAFSIDVIANAPRNSLAAFNPAEAPDLSGLLFGVLYGVLIFVGFETAANLAEETPNPKRSIPLAVLLSVAIVTAYYVITAYAQVAGFGFQADVLLDPAVAQAPLFALGSPAPDGYGGSSDFTLKLLEIVVLLDVMAVGLGCSTASSRGIFALARDRRIPGALASVSGGGRGTPVAAVALVEAWSVLMVVAAAAWDGLFALPETPHEFAMFAWLSTFGGFVLMGVYGLVSVGAFNGLGDHPNRAGVWIAALLGIAISLGALFGGVYKQTSPFSLVWVYAVAWTILGIVVTMAVRGRERAAEVLTDLHEPARG
jgi:amino acid transporter